MLGTSNNQGCSFRIKNLAGDQDILSLIPTAVGSKTWVVNGDAENFAVELPGSSTTTGTTNDNLNYLSWYDLKVTVYNGYTYVSIVDEAGTALLDKAQVPTLATSYGLGKMIFITGRYNSNIAIDDILVRSVKESEDIPSGLEFAEVKINYIDADGKVLKPAETANYSIGDIIELNSALTADFKVDETGAVWTAESEAKPATKYIYVSDNSADVKAEAGAEVNIVYRGVAGRRIALRPQIQLADGTMSTKDASGANIPFFYDSNKTGDVLFEGDVLTYYYPYYLLVDGLLYKTGANSTNEDHGTLEIEAGTGTQIKSPVTWTAATTPVQVIDEEGNAIVDEEGNPIMEDVQISNAVFAQETENIEGMTVVKDVYTSIRMANGAAASAIGGDVLVTTLEPGIYTITSATRSGKTVFLAGSEEVFTIESNGTVNTATSEAFIIQESTPIYIKQQSATTQYSDYVLITKVGEAEAADNISISDIQLATEQGFNEDGEQKIVVTYTVVRSGYEDIYPDAIFHYTVTKGGEGVAQGEKNPTDLEDGTFNIYLSDLEYATEYTLTIDKVSVLSYDFDEATFDMITNTLFEAEGELAKITFTTEAAPFAGTVGNEDNTSGWWTAFSPFYTMTDDQVAIISFDNYNSGSGRNWNNWLLIAQKQGVEVNGAGDDEYFALRNDNYGWGNKYDGSSLYNNFNWDMFISEMNGSHVDMMLKMDEGKIVMESQITSPTDATYEYKYTSSDTEAEGFTFFFTVELSHIKNLSVEFMSREEYDRATGIASLAAAEGDIEAVYTIGGVQQQNLQKGLNIVKYANGTVKKVFVK